MKLSYKNRNIILLSIGFLLVGSGIVKMIFKIKVDEKISANIQNGLLLVAAVIFFISRKKEDKKVEEVEEAQGSQEAEEVEEIKKNS